jgi:peptidoglycan/LPS O-acetylase OafA/YrhL
MNDTKSSLPLAAKPLQNPKGEGRRFHELDAMRGLAAVVVLGNHFRNMFYPTATFAHGWQSVFLYPLVSGRESVMFFFLLSGFVLSLPFLRGKRQPYSIFLRRRILRIYGPYLGALVLALIGCALWHNRLGSTGWRAATWSAQVDLRSVLQHVLFIGNYNYERYNTAFWSLVYEMRISMIFPLLFVVANRLKARYTLLIVAACTLVGVHAVPRQFLITFEYAGVFLIGVLLAKNLDALNDLYRRQGTAQHILWAILSLLLYFGGHRIASMGALWHLGDMPVVLGAAGLLILGLNSVKASRALNSVVPTFLGRISYSLYLVHGTVLFAMAAALQNKFSPPVFFLIYLPTAILLSWGFYVAVESPFMMMSRNVGRRSSQTA